MAAPGRRVLLVFSSKSHPPCCSLPTFKLVPDQRLSINLRPNYLISTPTHLGQSTSSRLQWEFSFRKIWAVRSLQASANSTWKVLEGISSRAGPVFQGALRSLRLADRQLPSRDLDGYRRGGTGRDPRWGETAERNQHFPSLVQLLCPPGKCTVIQIKTGYDPICMLY